MIGNGNVAVDVARMLALTEEEIAPTDTTDEAIAAIVGSGIREIVMLGRRGPAQAAFTTPELQELGELAGADVVVDPADLELDPASAAALEDDRATARRNVDILRDYAARAAGGQAEAADPALPASRRSRSSATGGSRRSRSCGTSSSPTRPGAIRAAPPSAIEMIPCSLVLRSVGYRGVAAARACPFDEEHGVIPNDGGRVLDDDGAALRASTAPAGSSAARAA